MLNLINTNYYKHDTVLSVLTLTKKLGVPLRKERIKYQHKVFVNRKLNSSSLSAKQLSISAIQTLALSSGCGSVMYGQHSWLYAENWTYLSTPSPLAFLPTCIFRGIRVFKASNTQLINQVALWKVRFLDKCELKALYLGLMEEDGWYKI